MSAESKQPQGLVPGRIVHFVDSAGGICPAVVIAAGEGKFTRLHVFGFTKSQDAVLDVEYDVNGHASTWHWMFEGQENRYDKIESAVMKDAALPQECLQGIGPMGTSGAWWSGCNLRENPDRPKDRYGLWRRPGRQWYIRDLLSMNILASEVDYNFGVHVCRAMNEEWQKREQQKA
jgi:hypothetical protein